MRHEMPVACQGIAAASDRCQQNVVALLAFEHPNVADDIKSIRYARITESDPTFCWA